MGKLGESRLASNINQLAKAANSGSLPVTPDTLCVSLVVAFQRNRQEKDELIFKHIQQRQQMSLRQRSEIHTHELEIELLRQDIQDYRNLKTDKPSKLRGEFRKASEKASKSRKPKRIRDKNQDRGGYEPEI